jgi:thioredoxin reductase (NADPH)
MSTNSTSESRELVETPDLNGAYPRLDEAGIAALAPLGRRRRVQPEEVLFREGDRECQFFVVLAGKVASVEGHGTPEERVISVHGRGRFLGELSLLTGEGSYYTAVAVNGGEVLAVPASRLRELVARDQGIGDLILRAYLIRRSILIGLGAGLRIIGSRYSPDARRVRDFAARNRLPYRWLDLDGDPGAEALLAQFGVAPQDTPIVILHARVLRNPSNAELAAAAGLPAPSSSPARCDLLVVGSGPGGMSAAVYGASEGLRTMVLDGTATSVVIATGARYRRLDVPQLDHFEKMSVYYAASQAEALLCAGDPVAVVGGGNSAGQAAVFLSRHAGQVTLIVREHDLSEYMSRYLIDQLERIPNVRIMLVAEVRELLGDDTLEAAAVADGRTGERSVLPARALFVFIGVRPCSGWLGGLVDLDARGFVRTGQDTGSSALETSRLGIFAVGDVRSGSAKRVAAAVGEGAMAIRLAFERTRPG